MMDELTNEDYLRAAEIMSRTRPYNVHYTAQILAEIIPINLINEMIEDSYILSPEEIRQMVKRDPRTMTAIADSVGVSRTAIRNWMSGEKRPTAENMEKFLQAMNR